MSMMSRRSSNSNSNLVSASPPTDAISSSPGREQRRNRLRRLALDKVPKEVADLFERLVPYMDGKHHIEEIIYREAVSRRQLSLVLKYYSNHIVTVYHY
ncbi:hypothetical protein BX666DRAFT_658750 [Dichotomocladium elegans]|nr:hypothetical protein BX666DRAFT_658750 [Dichotomocladium elegans]